jgi:hypothetical protein
VWRLQGGQVSGDFMSLVDNQFASHAVLCGMWQQMRTVSECAHMCHCLQAFKGPIFSTHIFVLRQCAE